MIEYIIIAFDAGNNQLERSIVQSTTQFAAHREAQTVGRQMMERGAYNVHLYHGAELVGFMPDWSEPPIECWPREYKQAVHDLYFGDKLPRG